MAQTIIVLAMLLVFWWILDKFSFNFLVTYAVGSFIGLFFGVFQIRSFNNRSDNSPYLKNFTKYSMILILFLVLSIDRSIINSTGLEKYIILTLSIAVLIYYSCLSYLREEKK